eukprot:COSAG02_NODE_741_length_17813_cov_51.487863_4_plen_145_part_00
MNYGFVSNGSLFHDNLVVAFHIRSRILYTDMDHELRVCSEWYLFHVNLVISFRTKPWMFRIDTDHELRVCSEWLFRRLPLRREERSRSLEVIKMAALALAQPAMQLSLNPGAYAGYVHATSCACGVAGCGVGCGGTRGGGFERG